MNHDFSIQFVCSVCGLPTGDSLSLDTKFWDEQTGINLTDGRHWASDYVDNRHKQCEIDHGSFKEMVEEYQKNLKASPQQAEDFVKENRKRVDFDREVEKILESEEKMV